MYPIKELDQKKHSNRFLYCLQCVLCIGQVLLSTVGGGSTGGAGEGGGCDDCNLLENYREKEVPKVPPHEADLKSLYEKTLIETIGKLHRNYV